MNLEILLSITAQEAHNAANLKAFVLLAVGFGIGILIGVKSKKHIPGWQIFTLAFIVIVTMTLVDGGFHTQFGSASRVILAGMIPAIFLSRSSEKSLPQILEHPPEAVNRQTNEEQE
jgi:hypothetical protein